MKICKQFAILFYKYGYHGYSVCYENNRFALVTLDEKFRVGVIGK